MATNAEGDLNFTEDEIHSIMTEKAKELFQLCDTENKGFITRQDLQKLQDELALSTEQLEDVYDSLDADGNGCLTIDEFIEGFGNFLGLQYQERRGSIYEDGLPNSPRDDDQFHNMMQHFGAYGVFEDQEAIKALWERLKSEEPHLVMSFENCLGKISSEMKRTHHDYKTLESALKCKTSAHDEEVKQLYEEMENQIKQEKERILDEEKARERHLRAEMERELAEKDNQLQEVMRKQQELEQRLSMLNMSDIEIKHENEKLHKEKNELLQQLERSHDALEDQKSYMETVQKKTKDERKDRVLQAVHITHGIALERETLVRQLDLLKDMNKKLRDDHDIADARKSPGPILKEESKSQLSETDSTERKPKQPLKKQGSLMSNYFSPAISQSSRTSANSFLSEDLELVEDDGIDYDDDVIDKNGSVHHHSNNNDSPIDYSHTDLNSNEKTNGVQSTTDLSSNVITSRELRAKSCHSASSSSRASPSLVELENSKTIYTEGASSRASSSYASEKGHVRNVSGHRASPVHSGSENAKASPSERRRIEFMKHSKQLAILTKSSSEEQESQKLEEAQHDGDNHPIAFVSVSLDSLDRQSPIGANNATSMNGSDPQDIPTPARLFKVVFVGDSGVGKSSFIHRFCKDQFNGRFCATIGVDFQVKSLLVGDKMVALQLWDTAGQERYRSITKQYFRKADGIIVMYDVTSESSYRNVRQWMDSIHEGSEDDTIIMLLGNKTDLAEDDSQRPVKYKNGVQLADAYGCLFYETSAKRGQHIKESMTAMASLLEDKEDKEMEKALKLDETPKKKKCCD